jgi:hypothetical protein
VLVGLSDDRDALWRYRLLVGWEERQFAARVYHRHDAPVAEAELIWSPSGMTTVTGTLTRSIEDAAREGVAGYTYTAAALTLDDEYDRDILVQATGGLQQAGLPARRRPADRAAAWAWRDLADRPADAHFGDLWLQRPAGWRRRRIEVVQPQPGSVDGAVRLVSARRLGLDFADLDAAAAAAAALIAQQSAGVPFRYVVTPNADHLVRLARQPGLAAYEGASLRLLDSQVVARGTAARAGGAACRAGQ